MNDREQKLLVKRIKDLTKIISEQHRLPKSKRDQELLNNTVAAINTITEWLRGGAKSEEPKKPGPITKEEFRQHIGSVVDLAPKSIMIVNDLANIEPSLVDLPGPKHFIAAERKQSCINETLQAAGQGAQIKGFKTTKMKLDKAMMIGESWVRRLEPHCERIAIAGSIRRRKGEVRDIEILCIPKSVDDGQMTMFKDPPHIVHRDSGFVRVFTQLSTKDVMFEKGDPTHSKYIRLYLIAEKISIDIFTATQKNWGYLLAVRTGPAEYSHKVLANKWVRMGYHGEHGYLTKGGQPVPIEEEETLFDLLKMEYVEPENRRFP